ncbi:MAG: methyltransferase domain-containing protein [Planctomycetota bacterium]
MTGTTACIVCGSDRSLSCLEAGGLPLLCNALFPTRDEAVACARGDLDLRFCRDCGHLWNRAYEPGRLEYEGDYETSLHFSPLFHDWVTALAGDLVDRHELSGRTVLELGCGRGEFLGLFADRCRCVGYDTSFDAGRTELPADVTVHARYFDPAVDRDRGDLVACRHVLEHVPRPADLVATLCSATAPGGRVYLEVPNGLFTLERLGIWDLIYEHVSYFTPSSLGRLLADRGLAVDRLEAGFGGQFLQASFAPDGVAGWRPEDPARLAPLAEGFADTHRRTVAHWSAMVRDRLDRGLDVAVWGAGSKGVTFLNSVDGGAGIRHVVDVNPRKQGLHVPGTGQRIVAPAALGEAGVDAVLIMNPLYEQEIRATLAGAGLRAEVAVVS